MEENIETNDEDNLDSQEGGSDKMVENSTCDFEIIEKSDEDDTMSLGDMSYEYENKTSSSDSETELCTPKYFVQHSRKKNSYTYSDFQFDFVPLLIYSVKYRQELFEILQKLDIQFLISASNNQITIFPPQNSVSYKTIEQEMDKLISTITVIKLNISLKNELSERNNIKIKDVFINVINDSEMELTGDRNILEKLKKCLEDDKDELIEHQINVDNLSQKRFLLENGIHDLLREKIMIIGEIITDSNQLFSVIALKSEHESISVIIKDFLKGTCYKTLNIANDHKANLHKLRQGVKKKLNSSEKFSITFSESKDLVIISYSSDLNEKIENILKKNKGRKVRPPSMFCKEDNDKNTERMNYQKRKCTQKKDYHKY